MCRSVTCAIHRSQLGHLPKLILNHGNTFPVLFSENVVQQGGFTWDRLMPGLMTAVRFRDFRAKKHDFNMDTPAAKQ